MVEWIGVPINNDSCEKVEGSNSKRLIFIRAENEAMESRIDARLTENNGAMDRLRADMGEMRQGDHPVDGRAGAGRCRLDHRRPWDPDSLARAADLNRDRVSAIIGSVLTQIAPIRPLCD